MSLRKMAYIMCCFILMCLFIASCATKTIDTGEMALESAKLSSMEYNKDSVKSIIVKAKPLIEEISGLTYKKEIKFSFVKRKAYRDLFADGLSPMYEKLMKGADRNTIDRQVDAIAHQTSQVSMGMYFPREETIFLVPENAKENLERYEIKEEDVQDFLSLFVIYRMVSVLDDQHFNLMEKADTSDMEASNAFRSLTEGHAVYVTDKVAERLKLSEAAKDAYLKCIAGITDETNPVQQQTFNLRYVKGKEFVDKIINKNGIQGIKQAFASPPVSMRQIMNPDDYLSKPNEVAFDCLALMKKVAQKLPIEGMQSQSASVDSMRLNAILVSQGLTSEDADSITSDCLGGAAVNAAKQAQIPIVVSATVLNFTDHDAVVNYVTLTRKMEQASRAQVNAMLNAEVKVIEENDTSELDGFDAARYLQAEQTVDGKVTKSYSAEGIVGNFYISIAFINPEKEPNEENALDILTEINKERMSMM